MAAAGPSTRAFPRRRRQLWSRRGRRGRAVTRWRQPKRGPRALPLALRCWCCRHRCCSRRHRRGRRKAGLRRVLRETPGRRPGPAAVRATAVPRLRPTRCRRGGPALPALPRPRSGLGPPSGPRRLAGRRGGVGRASARRGSPERCRPRRDGARPLAGPRPELGVSRCARGARWSFPSPAGVRSEAAPRPGLLRGWRVPGPARAGVKSSRGWSRPCPDSVCVSEF